MDILLIDDHPLFRKGTAQVLFDLGIASTIHEAGLAREALDLLERTQAIDCIFLDLQLPDMDGLGFITELRMRDLGTPVLVLSSSTEPTGIDYLVKAGASAYLDKSSVAAEITEAIAAVVDGRHYIGRNLRHRLDDYRATLVDGGRPIIHLTHRQRQVLQCLCNGQTNQQIASTLRIAESTVKGHVSTLYELLAVDNRTQCIKAARDHHLLERPDGPTSRRAPWPRP